MTPRSGGSRGFTLLEMAIALAVVAILTSVATPMILQRIVDSRVTATQAEARALYEAMVGLESEHGSFGFVGDMGRLPASFEQLVTPSGLPAYSVQTVRGIGMGWRGPYISAGTSPTDYLLDAFGRPYSGAPTGQVRSHGADGIAGNADDIVYPGTPPVITGSVYVTIKTIADGKTITDPPGYAVDLFYSHGGTQAVVRDSSPPFRFDNVTMGLHAIQVVRTQGNLATVGSATISLRRGAAALIEIWF